MNLLPIEYHIEVYEDSFINDPVWDATTTTPFLALSIGDRFDHRGIDAVWSKLPNGEIELRIKDLNHLLFQTKTNIVHKLMVKLELVGHTQDF